MKINVSVGKSFIISTFLMICLCDSYAQSSELTLMFKNINKKELSFPCLQITDCIDSIYKDKDTLFIRLQDTRKFYKDERGTIVISQGYGIAKRNLTIQIPIQFNFNFVVLKTFDFVCTFKRNKNKENIYKIFSMKEFADYSNKEFRDVKDSDDVNIRGNM